MKPFLILQLRPIDVVADNEFEAFLRYGKLDATEVQRIRMDQGDLPDINLDDFSGVIIGGGPSNVSDEEGEKYDYQSIFEKLLEPLVKEIIASDFPCLGACYGLGALTNFGGGKMGREAYGEKLAAVDIHMNKDGNADQLLAGLDNPFQAIVGHKEACQIAPDGAIILASSQICPTQMFRIGENVYGTQFHPELDVQDVGVRADAYQHKGYFPPEELEQIKAYFSDKEITVPMMLLERFVARYR